MNRLISGVLFFFTVYLWMNPVLWSENDMNLNNSKDLNGSVESIRVLWFVSEYKRTDYAKISENEAKRMLFKPLDIRDRSITFGRKKCSNVSFERKEVGASEYLDKNYDITPQWLGIDDSVLKVIQTDCDIPGFNEYMQLKDGRLVILVNGVFFFLQSNITY